MNLTLGDKQNDVKSVVQSRNTLFPGTKLIGSESGAKRTEVIEWTLELFLVNIPMPLLSRIVEQEEGLNYFNCRTILNFGATCCDVRKIISRYIPSFVWLLLKDKLEKNIFSDNELEVKTEEDLDEDDETVLEQEALDLQRASRNEHDVSLTMLASQSWEKEDATEEYRKFREAFEAWNFDLRVYDYEVGGYQKAKAVNKFRVELCGELIRGGFIENPKHALCIIKKLVIGYFDTPGDRFGTRLGGTVAFDISVLLEKLIKNTTPFRVMPTKRIIDGEEVEVIYEFDRLVERTISIHSESIDWIVMKGNDVLDEDDPKKAIKVFQFFTLLIQNDVIGSGSKHIDLILRQTMKWLEFTKGDGEFNGPGHSCLELCVELTKKGMGTKLVEEEIGERMYHFLSDAFVINCRRVERLLEALAQNKVLRVDLKFTIMIVGETMKLLKHSDPSLLMIFSDSGILINFPEYHEKITVRALELVNEKTLFFHFIIILDSLVRNKVLVLNPERIKTIVEYVIHFSQYEYLWNSDNKYLVRSAFSIISELLENNLISNPECLRKLGDHIKEISSEKVLSIIGQFRDGAKICNRIRSFSSKFDQFDFNAVKVEKVEVVKPRREIGDSEVSIQSLYSLPAIMLYMLLIAIAYNLAYNGDNG